jgi:acyl-CoA reductase-like NAD-dependent aldehyde dehydrogenase
MSTFSLIDPSTEETFAEVPDQTAEDADRAVNAAVGAPPGVGGHRPGAGRGPAAGL